MRWGAIVLSHDPEVQRAVRDGSESCIVATSPDNLFDVAREAGRCVVIIDRDDEHAADALARLATSPLSGASVAVVVRDAHPVIPTGVTAIVAAPALRAAIGKLVAPAGTLLRVDQLLAPTLLGGTLDAALEAATRQLAIAFAATRGVVSLGDANQGVASDETWTVARWDLTARNCTLSAAIGTTVIDTTSESYCAVGLGERGFVGLVDARARVYSADERRALAAIAARFATELGWRAARDRTAEDLDRLASGPAYDPMLGVWNRVAMGKLGDMAIAAANRGNIPLTVLGIDVVDLAGVNTRFGMAAGDRALRRVADVLRATVRVEDAIGRWSGSKLALLLTGTTPDNARRVGERLHTALASRPVPFAIDVAIGVAALAPDESAVQLLDRVFRATQPGRVIATAPAPSSSRPPPSQPLELLGNDLRGGLGGSYRLLHEISRGGMGVVYRAEDLALERPVAIKMLRPELAEDRTLVDTLRTEAALLARIQHPNLVQIYAFGQSGGDSYLVMDLVEGESLQHAVERHRNEKTAMPLPDLATTIDEVAAALDALHERGIVHRDVKPANVIRDPFRNRTVLVDVGIARRQGELAQSAGTPGFMAPEVFGGEEAGLRSDVYGLAATAYTVLTLQPPWGEGDFTAIATRQLTEAPPPPSSIRVELSPVDGVLLEALSPNPAERPASAGAFARALSRALHVATPPKSSPTRRVGDVILPARLAAVPRTRGVVFRSVARALGIRDSERLREAIGVSRAELARALAESAPLAWEPTSLLVDLLATAPLHVGRDGDRLAREVARATVRASFRRFFPASAATLVPERTLSAIRNVWSRYHSWGVVSAIPISAHSSVIRMTETLREPSLCVWTSGMLEQLVVLSGGRSTTIAHDQCEARGADACTFDVTWEASEQG